MPRHLLKYAVAKELYVHMTHLLPELTTVIITWNSEETIRTCLASLLHSTKGIESETIVVDNNSKDGTCRIVRNDFPYVRLLSQSKNIGFGSGNNIGISKAMGQYILLLNPDTKVNRKAIHTMVRFLDHHTDTGAVGPEQKKRRGSLIYTVSKITPKGLLFHIVESCISSVIGRAVILSTKPMQTMLLNAGCVMVRRSIFNTHQWFNPSLFLYGEEFDLFPKIIKKGWKIYLLRSCSIFHFREKSINQTGLKYFFVFRSFSALMKQNITEKLNGFFKK
jgi:GT2 family glycosyltransferase